MANNYDKILTLANANNMGLSNTIKRDYGIPLDFTSVQASYEAALTYAATNTLAYVGQPISVGDKLYIVTAESQGKYPAEVEEGGTQIDVFLAEVGSATEGDGSTIDLKDGVLSLHGIDGKDSGTYVPTLVDGVLTWNAPDNTTVDGLTASVDALNLKVFGKEANEEAGTEKVDGLVDTVAANTEAIADNAKAIGDNAAAIENITKVETGAIATAVAAEAEARDTAIENAFADIVGTVAEDTTVVGMINAVDAKIPTNNNQLENGAGYQTASDVATAITNANKADKATTLAGYGITDAYTKDEVNNAISAMTHMSTKIVESAPSVETAEAGVIYLVQENPEAGTYVEYILIEDGETKSVEQIGSTATDLSDYITTGALATTLAPYAKTADVVTNDEFTAFEQTNSQAIADARTNAVKDIEAKGYAVETSVAERLSGKVDNATLDSYYTKEQANELLNTKANAEATTTELAKKVETAQIRHTSEGVGEGVTKDGTALTITVDTYKKSEVYTKSETDAAITAKINSVTGGESAADVKLALEDYRDALNAEVWGAKAAEWTKRETDADGKVIVTYTPQYGETSRVDELEVKVGNVAVGVVGQEGYKAPTGLFEKVATAQATATQAANDLTTLVTSGQVATNKQSIDNLAKIVSGENSEDTNSHAYRIGALETANSTHATEFTTLNAKVDTIVDTTIPTLTTRVGTNETAITAINNTLNGVGDSEGLIATVNKKANVADVYTTDEVDAKIITSGEVVHGDTDSITIADNKITININSYTKGEVDDLLANLDQTEIENNIKANADNIAVLVGADKDTDGKATKSVRTIAAEEVAKIVDGAPEALDTLKEIADWIIDDNTGAAAIVEDIAKHSTILAGFGTAEGEVATVKKYVDDSIAAIPQFVLEAATTEKLGGIKSATGANKVTVDTNGVASVASVSTDSLVQGTETLILNGGNAGVKTAE